MAGFCCGFDLASLQQLEPQHFPDLAELNGGALDDPLPGYIPPEPESPRGYGLWISRQLCDLVELRAEGGVLRVRLHLSMES